MTQAPNTNEACSFCDVELSVAESFISHDSSFIYSSCITNFSIYIASRPDCCCPKHDVIKLLSSTPTAQELKNHLDLHVAGLSQAKIALSVLVSNHYKRVLHNQNSDVKIDKTNATLIGDTGTGKTLLIETLARMLGVPFVIADASNITPQAYKGDSVDSILESLIDKSKSILHAECGIVFIDEIDKISTQLNTESYITGKAVQDALLKIVEGTEVTLSKTINGMTSTAIINTHNILFIVGGAFTGINEIVAARTNKKQPIGFMVENTLSDDEMPTTKVCASDLKEFGMTPEFIGRFPVNIQLEKMTDKKGMAIVIGEDEVNGRLTPVYKKIA
ncbi:MAG: AAA domain-containing protein [Endozoicomonadaceae bacterium]|nr:AAA domain-containing protein [Endozoicomonadaceae bacterium]